MATKATVMLSTQGLCTHRLLPAYKRRETLRAYLLHRGQQLFWVSPCYL
jgi:hypothetical protein